MDAQDKGNPKSGTDTAQKNAVSDELAKNRGADVASEEVQYEHFSADDPHRTTRIATLNRETGEFLSKMGGQYDGLGTRTDAEFRKLQADADERAAWGKTQTDAVRSVLRMGVRTPPRTARVL